MPYIAFDCIAPEANGSDKPPIIFLHGVTASKEFWNDVPQQVADATNRMVYALDARNHGDSEWVENYDLSENVDDLFEFMDAQGIKRAVLVGHSMGGLTAIHAALKKPERFEKIAIEDITVSPIPDELLDIVLGYIHGLQAATEKIPPKCEYSQAVKFLFEFVWNSLPEEIKLKTKKMDISELKLAMKQDENGRWRMKGNINEMFRAIQKLKEKPLNLASGTFEGPTCFIYGKDSEFDVAKDAEVIKEHFPNAELIGVKDSGHSVHLDQPKEFKDILIKFLLQA